MPTDKSERRIIYLQRKESGHCPRCGGKKNKSDIQHTYCEDCRSFFRNYQKEGSESANEIKKSRYLERKNNRQCPRCGKKHGKRYSNIICLDCLDKQYGYNSKIR